MDLSIIIPSYNTKLLLKRCLDSILTSLKNGKLSYEIIVVDNTSTDGSVELARKYPQVQLIVNQENVGYGRANNQGIKRARGEYVLLLNSDIQVLDQGIEKLLHFAKIHKNAFVGGKLFNEDNTPQTSCGPFFTLPVIVAALFFQGDKLGLTRWSPAAARVVDWVSGACLVGKRSDFLGLGGFDETIFMYMEEIDLLYRAARKGYTTYFCPQARFIHTGAASSGDRRSPVGNIFRGLVYFYKKHHSDGQLAWVRRLLRGKAWLGIAIGKLSGDKKLKQIYEEALAVVERKLAV